MNKVYILAMLLLSIESSWAQFREFQTTRLNSTAGAGIASVLSTEAAILNPASSAFFTGSSISYQTYTTALKKPSDEREALSDDFASQNRSQGLFMSDNGGTLKGGAAYLRQEVDDYRRQHAIAHGAGPISKSSSIGLTYSYLDDTQKQRSGHHVSHQLTLGFMQIFDERTIFGLVLVDPTRTTPMEERIIGGLQYQVADRLTLIADIGTRYTQDVKEKHLWRAAAQLQLFNDFFFRIGKFHDNIWEMKGTGWGVGWVGPKLGVEFAQKISEQFGNDGFIYEGETLIDTSVSAIIKF